MNTSETAEIESVGDLGSGFHTLAPTIRRHVTSGGLPATLDLPVGTIGNQCYDLCLLGIYMRHYLERRERIEFKEPRLNCRNYIFRHRMERVISFVVTDDLAARKH